MTNSPFEQLQVWQKGILLTKEVYKVTKDFPKDELYGLASQMRRAAVSIPSNIAEGSQRSTDKDFSHFVHIARGSLAELQTQVIIAGDCGYIPVDSVQLLISAIIELAKMLRSFSVTLTSR